MSTPDSYHEGLATRVARPEQRSREPQFGHEVFISALVPALRRAEAEPNFQNKIIQLGQLRTCKEADKMKVLDLAHQEGLKRDLRRLIEGDEPERNPRFKVAGTPTLNTEYSSNPDSGYTYMACIGQSSITFHTYPELMSVSVDLHVCSSEMKKIEEEGRDLISEFFELARRYFGASPFRTAHDASYEKRPDLSDLAPRLISPI